MAFARERSTTLLLLLACWPACRKAPATSPASAALVIAVPYELDSLDPHVADRLSSFAVLFNLYEPLVDTDADMKIRPALAATWESPDPLTWIFHLRPSVTFHSGKPLRAADVVYSLDRLRRDAGLQVRDFTRDITQVEAIGDLTVKVRTASPSGVFLAKLRHVAIVPEGATSDALRGRADGTGPYALAGWGPREGVRLQRNQAYWGRPPQAGEVRFALGLGPEKAMDGLLTGRYQLVKCDSRKVEAALGRSGRVLVRESLYVKYLAFDLSREVTPFCRVRPNPFRDLRVRRAVAAAIDRRKLVSSLSSAAVPATQPVPRFVFGFDPSLPVPGPDVELARRLLREAGLGGGFEVVLHGRPFARDALPAIQEDLRRIGILAEPWLVSDTEHFDLLKHRSLTFWLTRIGCDTGDAGELFEDLVHSPDAAGRFGLLNDGGYVNPKLDAVIERSVRLVGAADRLAAFQEIMRAVVRDQALVPLYNDQDVYALEPSLSWQPRADSEIRAADIVLRP